MNAPRRRIPFPKTTPECERLLRMVIEGVNSTVFDAQKKEAARVALKRLRKKGCTKALEYVIQVSCNGNVFDTFEKEMCKKATEYLNELS